MRTFIRFVFWTALRMIFTQFFHLVGWIFLGVRNWGLYNFITSLLFIHFDIFAGICYNPFIRFKLVLKFSWCCLVF